MIGYELTMNTVFEYYSLNVTTYYDIDKKGNHILDEKQVLLLVYIHRMTADDSCEFSLLLLSARCMYNLPE
jgi:hypothetical protein